MLVARRTLAVLVSVTAITGFGMTSASVASAAPSKAFTAAQVAKHNTPANCWTIVGRNVYNITKWVPMHPGGAAMVTPMCGKNGTALFTSKHGTGITSTGTKSVAKATLAKYKVGTLKK